MKHLFFHLNACGRLRDLERLVPAGDFTALQRLALLQKQRCSVYISCASENDILAAWLCDALWERGHRTYFHGLPIPTLARQDFDVPAFGLMTESLGAAQSLVVLAASPAQVHRGWVDYEWRSFYIDTRRRRKPNAMMMVLLLGDEQAGDLPSVLARCPVVRYNNASPGESVDQIDQLLKGIANDGRQ